MSNHLSKRPWRLAVAASALVAGSYGLAEAHHPGAGGNTGAAGPINTLSATTLEAGRTAISVTYDYQALEELSDAALIAAAEADIDVHSLGSIEVGALTASYGVTDDLTLTIRAPFVKRNDILEAHEHDPGPPPEFEVESHGSTQGLGDISLLAQLRLLNDLEAGLEGAVLAGVKAPTGKSNRLSPEDELQEAEFQPGSGSWDWLLGAALTKRSGAWSFDGGVLYQLVTEGTQNTDLGDLLFYGVSASYRVALSGGETHLHADGHAHDHGGGTALDLVLELNGEWQDKEEHAGSVNENSGGNVVMLSPGARLSIDDWAAFVSLGLPVLEDVNGIQSEPEWRLRSGVSLSF